MYGEVNTLQWALKLIFSIVYFCVANNAENKTNLRCVNQFMRNVNQQMQGNIHCQVHFFKFLIKLWIVIRFGTFNPTITITGY